MKNNTSKSLLISLLLCCTFYSLQAQPIPETHKGNIINGKLWVPSYTKAKGSPFFLEKLDLKGNLLFDGKWFKNIEFSYNLEKDEIITTILTPDGNSKTIVVNRYHLDGFSFDNEYIHYDFLRGDRIAPELKADNYYQVFNSGKLIYAIKRQKFKDLASMEAKGYEYTEFNNLFIVKNNQLTEVKNKNQLFLVLDAKKTEIRKFIRKNQLKINKKHPLDIVPVLNHFDQ